MNDYRSLNDVAAGMGLPMGLLIQMLAHRRLIEEENRPSIYAYVFMYAKKHPYADGKGGHRYDWSHKRVATLIKGAN
jgi:hypothetical protein